MTWLHTHFDFICMEHRKATTYYAGVSKLFSKRVKFDHVKKPQASIPFRHLLLFQLLLQACNSVAWVRAPVGAAQHSPLVSFRFRSSSIPLQLLRAHIFALISQHIKAQCGQRLK